MGKIEKEFHKARERETREFKIFFVTIAIALVVFFISIPILSYWGYDDWRRQRNLEVKEMLNKEGIKPSSHQISTRSK